jgi:hypothetical protein
VEIIGPGERKETVRAFWAGNQTWKARYSSDRPGSYKYRTVCSDETNSDLHKITGSFHIEQYRGSNPLLRHGSLRVSSDQRHFEHADGTPFFWLGDTWWFGLCKRFRWPKDFEELADFRVKQGFTVVQITSGLNPETTGGGAPPFDPRSMNEAGYAWQDNYTSINPAYFDLADQRIRMLVDKGLVPCIVGAWGYHLPTMGVERMKQHWDYMISRWGAWPVVWCLAGELTMPYWPPRTPDELESLGKKGLTIADRRRHDSEFQKQGWTEVARSIRQNDPYHRLLTLHPQGMHPCRDQIDDHNLLDFDLLQTSHDDWWGMPASNQLLVDELAKTPHIPVLIGEVVYEGLQEHNREDVVRFAFWAAVLSGAAGHTYGAGGIFEMEAPHETYGLTADGDWHSYLDQPYTVAMKFPGAQQIAYGKKLLSQFEWWHLEPQPSSVEPHWTRENNRLPYAAAIPGELVIVYLPELLYGKGDSLHMWLSPTIAGLSVSTNYEAFWFCPSTGEEEAIEEVKVDPSGEWVPPLPKAMVDWVLVVAKKGIRKLGS